LTQLAAIEIPAIMQYYQLQIPILHNPKKTLKRMEIETLIPTSN